MSCAVEVLRPWSPVHPKLILRQHFSFSWWSDKERWRVKVIGWEVKEKQNYGSIFKMCTLGFTERKKGYGGWTGARTLNINIGTVRAVLSSSSALFLWHVLSPWSLDKTHGAEVDDIVGSTHVHQRPHSGQRSICCMKNYDKLLSQRWFPSSRAEFSALLFIRPLFRACTFLSLERRQWVRVCYLGKGTF